MSSFKPCCLALLCAVMLAPACSSTTSQATVESPVAPTVSCDGALFNSQCVHKGDTVTFGKYPQATETPEPIEWIVLDIMPKTENAGGRILLLSKYVIDAKPYDTSHKNSYGMNIYPTWAESDIRKWLNDTGDSGFLRSAYFAAQDQSLIVEVTNSTTGYGERNDGGVDTQDKVFLLDTKEYESYLHYNLGLGYYNEANDDEDDETNDDSKTFDAESFKEEAANDDDDDDEMPDVVVAKATHYAIKKGVNVLNTSDANVACTHIQCSTHWWLRSPADHPGSVATGDAYGGVFFIGVKVTATDLGVRPTLWVNY